MNLGYCRLLKGRNSDASRWSGRFCSTNIVVNDPRLVAAIARLPRPPDDHRHSRGEVFIETRRSAGRWRVRNGSALRLVVECIATLMIGRSGQSFVQQDSAIAIGYSDPTHCRKTRGQAVAVCRRINDGGAGDGPDIRDGGRLIRGHSGAEQVGDGDRGDDQDDGYYDQKLNQRKPAPSLSHSIRIVAFFEHFS